MSSYIKSFAKSLSQCAGIFALVGSGAACGLAQTVASPASVGGAGGNAGNYYPFSSASVPNTPSMRYQQVFSAGDFSAVKGSITIRQIAFRISANGGNAFNTALLNTTPPDIQIDLSTTLKAVDGLSATFSDNVGGDDVAVYPRAPLTLSSAASDLGGYFAFDVIIVLANPFTYNPSLGNLLLDVHNYGLSYATLFDAQSTVGDGVSRVYAPLVTATSGTADSLGLSTQFSSVITRTISGSVTLEGSVNPMQTVVFKLTNLDTTTASPIIVMQGLGPVSGLTDTGSFSLNGIPAAHYSLNVKSYNNLGVTKSVDLTAANVSGLNFLLPAGDANNDNSVDSSDFGILIGAFGGSSSIDGSGYVPGADFNDDGLIDSADFGLLIGEFGSVGQN